MRKILLFVLLSSLPLIVSAQYKGLNSKKRATNKFLKKKGKPQPEIIVGLGAANFLGELGGANQIGTNFVKDFEFSMSRPSFQVAYRYRFHNRFAAKGGFYYQMVSGHDKTTKEPFRMNRNLHFRSSIYEISAQIEFYFKKEESAGKKYKIKNAKRNGIDIQPYAFVGIGGFAFNPKAKYDGKWQKLFYLHTEGQGLPGGPKQYKRVSFCIPYGLGAVYKINREFKIGLEAGIRKTFTDYIDDVSGVYYDNKAIVAAHGTVAGQAADPSIYNMPADMGGIYAPGQQPSGVSWQSGPGYQRGDVKDKDSYMFINVTVVYQIPKKRKTRSKF